MYIHNVRYGFATNSSSTHSIVVFKTKKNVPDNTYGSDFGWDFFTAGTERAKRQYLGQIAKQGFMRVHSLEDEDAALIASKWAGQSIDPHGYIDHQSIIALPVKSNGNNISLRKEFFDDFLNFALKPNVAILGGNDNTEEEHPLMNDDVMVSTSRYKDSEVGNIGLQFFVEHNEKNLRAQYNQQGKFWTVFDKESGQKIRLSFVEDSDASKSYAPELVDIKITNYCEEGCVYCYQGSTTKGLHGETRFIIETIRSLGSLDTFEVAIGGGEPTEHPDLLEILDACESNDIKPSISTRNEDWIIENFDKIKSIIGAVGLSVDSVDVCKNKLTKLKLYIDRGIRINVQVAVGSCTEQDLIDIMKACKEYNVSVLLLGWKETHRGKTAKRHDVDLYRVMQSFQGEPFKYPGGETHTPWDGPSVGFDTLLVNETQAWLAEFGSPWMFTTKDGAHSMYIDCVTQKMGRSSYEGDNQLINILSRHGNINPESITSFFATV